MENIEKNQEIYRLLEALEDGVEEFANKNINYEVPMHWNQFGFKNYTETTKKDVISVNPYEFYASVIRDYILPQAVRRDYSRPLSKNLRRGKTFIESKRGYVGGDWMKEATFYNAMPRSCTSWDHDGNEVIAAKNKSGFKETGTFVKMMALLPTLKKMGVNTVYLLPISQFAEMDKKGDLGSPYAVQNFYNIDPNLKDPMVDTTLDQEFKAFVQACHILEMRVTIDIIPRTNSVDSDLIREMPESFYWIKTADKKNYGSPFIKALEGKDAWHNAESFEAVYAEPKTWEHISMFQHNPKETMPKKWEKALKKFEKSNGSTPFIKFVEKYTGLTTAFAFSDGINDTQPAWSDITFFRFYNDHPAEHMKYLEGKGEIAPYILFDTIKANLYPGKEKNEKIWDAITNILPRWQEKYGIDGARVDMGHALPPEMTQQIMEKARAIDPDFGFIAEELSNHGAATQKKLGYNMVIGSGWAMEQDIKNGKAKEFIETAHEAATPVFAGAETHDTPRLAGKENGEKLSKLMTLFNYFVPNGTPFINSAQQTFEKSPINTGLMAEQDAREKYPKSDMTHGRLALFDNYQYHYTTEGWEEMLALMNDAADIRWMYLDVLANKKYHVPTPSEAIAVGWNIKGEKSALLVIGNDDLENFKEIKVDIKELRTHIDEKSSEALEMLSTAKNDTEYKMTKNQFKVTLEPGQFVVFKL